MSLRVLFGLHCPVFISFLANSSVYTYSQHFRGVKWPFYELLDEKQLFDVCKSFCALMIECVYPKTVQYEDIHFRYSSMFVFLTHMLPSSCRSQNIWFRSLASQGQNHQFPKVFIINGKLQYRSNS